MKEFACGQVVPGCDAKFQAEDEQGVLEEVAVHAREAHGMEEVPPEVLAQVRAGIVDA